MPHFTRYDVIYAFASSLLNNVSFYCFYVGVSGSWNVGCMWCYFAFFMFGNVCLHGMNLLRIAGRDDVVWFATRFSKSTTSKEEHLNLKKWNRAVRWNLILGAFETIMAFLVHEFRLQDQERLMWLLAAGFITLSISLTAFFCRRGALLAWEATESVERWEIEERRDETIDEGFTMFGLKFEHHQNPYSSDTCFSLWWEEGWRKARNLDWEKKDVIKSQI